MANSLTWSCQPSFAAGTQTLVAGRRWPSLVPSRMCHALGQIEEIRDPSDGFLIVGNGKKGASLSHPARAGRESTGGAGGAQQQGP